MHNDRQPLQLSLIFEFVTCLKFSFYKRFSFSGGTGEYFPKGISFHYLVLMYVSIPCAIALPIASLSLRRMFKSAELSKNPISRYPHATGDLQNAISSGSKLIMPFPHFGMDVLLTMLSLHNCPRRLPSLTYVDDIPLWSYKPSSDMYALPRPPPALECMHKNNCASAVSDVSLFG